MLIITVFLLLKDKCCKKTKSLWKVVKKYDIVRLLYTMGTQKGGCYSEIGYTF